MAIIPFATIEGAQKSIFSSTPTPKPSDSSQPDTPDVGGSLVVATSTNRMSLATELSRVVDTDRHKPAGSDKAWEYHVGDSRLSRQIR